MLVQSRTDGLHLVVQHDHALLSGLIAGSWRLDDARHLDWITVMAASLHDAVWRTEDRQPVWNPATGRPHDFTDHPPVRRRRMLERGLPAIDALDPRIGALVREHHAALREERPPEGESARWVRFLDGLSLVLLLARPGSDPAERPSWLGRESLLTPPGRDAPLRIGWLDGTTASLSPFPLAGPVRSAVPYRALPRRRWSDPEALRRSWREAPLRHLPLALVP